MGGSVECLVTEHAGNTGGDGTLRRCRGKSIGRWIDVKHLYELACEVRSQRPRSVVSSACRGKLDINGSNDSWTAALQIIDRDSRPHTLSQMTSAEITARLVVARKAHPTWGPKKQICLLLREDASIVLPAISTVTTILRREGLVVQRRPRQRTPQSTFPLAAATAPNVVWCTDFKGKFRVNRKYCHPLTITDACSRYLLRCEPLEAERMEASKAIFEEVFKEFGLPLRMRSDNGRPFASTAIGGLSKLSIWWIKLGILPERITPGCPQENGRHERMHRTLKAEVASPPREDWQAQQEALRAWRDEFNTEDRMKRSACRRPPLSTSAARASTSSKSAIRSIPVTSTCAG
jgi:transposase InsO family protein